MHADILFSDNALGEEKVREQDEDMKITLGLDLGLEAVDSSLLETRNFTAPLPIRVFIHLPVEIAY